MARLNSPHRSTLSKTDLDEYPVWVWDDGNEGYLPLATSEPFTSEYGTLFIKANFEASGHQFEGYLIGINSFYAFAFFIKNKKIIININLTNEIESDLQTIYEWLNCRPFPLFPLYYYSSVRIDNKLISGTIFPRENRSIP
jgi:hypothetical protein